MKKVFCLFFIMVSFVEAAPSLYDRNYFGLDWGRGGAYGPDNGCPCRKDQDPDCQCDQ